MITPHHLEISMDLPLFPLTVGAEAAGAVHATYRMYANARRAPMSPKPDGGTASTVSDGFSLGSPADGKGFKSLLTFRGVLAYAAATPLIKAGLPAARALGFALAWTHLSEKSDVSLPYEATGERRPAGLYPEPYLTYLVCQGEWGSVMPAIGQEDGVRMPREILGQERTASICVLLNPIVTQSMQVCEAYLSDPRIRQ